MSVELQPSKTAGTKRTILLLTSRDPAIDFRLPLARALNAQGHDVRYLWLRRNPVLTVLGGQAEPRTMSLLQMFFYLWTSVRPAPDLLVFNSTNLAFPTLSRLIRLVVGGFWCLDMHDDLLYGKTGPDRKKAESALRTLIAGSDRIVHAAPTLIELFPQSQHLGNASNMTRMDRPIPDFTRLLVLASLDERFDFDFMAAVASATDLSFDIFGGISGGDENVSARLNALLAQHPNISYRGAYNNAQLPEILQQYALTLAPYAVNSPLTRYIDPLRYYHCLNAGIEVLSTDIPKARDFGSILHIVTTPEDVAATARGLGAGHVQRRNPGNTAAQFNWHNKADRLMEIIQTPAIPN